MGLTSVAGCRSGEETTTIADDGPHPVRVEALTAAYPFAGERIEVGRPPDEGDRVVVVSGPGADEAGRRPQRAVEAAHDPRQPHRLILNSLDGA